MRSAKCKVPADSSFFTLNFALVTFPTAILILRDSTGAVVASGNVALQFSQGKRIVGLLDRLMPGAIQPGSAFNGTLTIQLNYGPWVGGTMSALALQFSPSGVIPVPIDVIQ